MNEEKRDELLDLANDYIERRLPPAEVARLESWLDDDPEARRIFLDFSHDHALLHWRGVSEENADNIEAFPELRPRRLPTLWQTLAAAAVISLLALVLVRPPAESPTFAVMQESESARWESGNLPTAVGARLGTGSLALVRGLATIRFDSGAEVVLEAPVQIELIDEMNCTLLAGTAVAEVDEGAEGFTVHTPTARVIDHGTRFAVNVDPVDGGTKTQVFDGLVEVQLPESDEGIRLRTGQSAAVAKDAIGAVDEGPEEGTWSRAAGAIPRPGTSGWSRISTADGVGRDSYVWGGKPNDHVSEKLLLLKNSLDERGPHRKAYLGFDLDMLPEGEFEIAELRLRFAPTGWGLASHLDSSRFQVWGIHDDSLDDWSHGAMDWESAPANQVEDGSTLLPESAVLLGEFEVPRGVQSGTFGIRGPRLAEFLSADANGFATLVVTRATRENLAGGLVHAFASRRHPDLPAPVLAVKVRQ